MEQILQAKQRIQLKQQSLQNQENDAELIFTAMIDAAKADGQVDQEELKRLTHAMRRLDESFALRIFAYLYERLLYRLGDSSRDVRVGMKIL